MNNKAKTLVGQVLSLLMFCLIIFLRIWATINHRVDQLEAISEVVGIGFIAIGGIIFFTVNRKATFQSQFSFKNSAIFFQGMFLIMAGVILIMMKWWLGFVLSAFALSAVVVLFFYGWPTLNATQNTSKKANIKSRAIEIRLDQKKDILSVCQVGFASWENLFNFKDGTWFSVVYGEYYDNFLAVSLSPEFSANCFKKEFAFPPVNPAFVEAYQRNGILAVSPSAEKAGFYQLTPEILQLLGFDNQDQFCDEATPDHRIRNIIYAHDNFIFAFQPGRNFLTSAVLKIIDEQEQILKRRLETKVKDSLIQRIIETLNSDGEVNVQSDSIDGCIQTFQEVPSSNAFKKYWGHQDKKIIETIHV